MMKTIIIALAMICAAANGAVAAPVGCAGDCNGDGAVAIDELVTGGA